MNPLMDFVTTLATHPLIKWELWPTYGTVGVLLAALAAGLVELRSYVLGGPDVDLRRRSAGAFGWASASDGATSMKILELAPEEDSRQGEGWAVEMRGRRRPGQNGDFFDTVRLDQDHLAFFLGDVSGSGVASSLYQASCKALLRFATFTPGKAAAALEEVNSVLCQREPDGRFASMVYGVLQLSTGEVELVSAGHTDPVLQRVDGSTRRLVMPLRLPLGMTQRPEYKAIRISLSAGDRLMLVSDGLTHARDRAREPFSHERVRVASHKGRDQDLAGWVEAVLGAVDRYSPRCTDDRTAVALTWSGRPSL